MIIDPHAHIIPESFVEHVRKKRFGNSLTFEKGKPWNSIVARGKKQGKKFTLKIPLTKDLTDIDTRFKGMKKQGVGLQILSIIPRMTFYSLSPGLNKEVSSCINESLLGLTNEFPEKFRCMAQLPMQDPPAAARELERAVKGGHLGAQIGSNVGGKNLDERKLDAVWRKAVKLDVPFFIHPAGDRSGSDRLKDYYLDNFIGNPLETTICASILIFGGVFDRFPRIKFLLSHTGGFTPWIRGRWQHGYGERAEPKVNGAKSPNHYIKKFYYDTIIHDADAFEYACKILGANRIVYGTDYPFDMGYLNKAEKIPGLSRLPKEAQNKILTGNSKKLYKLKI